MNIWNQLFIVETTTDCRTKKHFKICDKLPFSYKKFNIPTTKAGLFSPAALLHFNSPHQWMQPFMCQYSSDSVITLRQSKSQLTHFDSMHKAQQCGSCALQQVEPVLQFKPLQLVTQSSQRQLRISRVARCYNFYDHLLQRIYTQLTVFGKWTTQVNFVGNSSIKQFIF